MQGFSTVRLIIDNTIVLMLNCMGTEIIEGNTVYKRDWDGRKVTNLWFGTDMLGFFIFVESIKSESFLRDQPAWHAVRKLILNRLLNTFNPIIRIGVSTEKLRRARSATGLFQNPHHNH
jgi:hypothetical protein